MTTPKVLLSHPRTQHAGEVARALHERGWLEAFHTGYRYGTDAPVWTRGDRRQRALLALPDRLVQRHGWPAVLSLVARLATRWGLRSTALRLEVAAAEGFDARVARRLDRRATAATVVHAYQGAARRTLRSAARCGALRVLEVTSLHHHARSAGGFDVIYPTRLLDRVEERVSAELRQADVLVVPSAHVAAEVRDRCADGARILVAPYGVDHGFESPAPDTSGRPVERRGLVFVGSVSSLKGLRVLLQALDLLADGGHPAVQVLVLGPGGREPELDRALREHPWIEIRGPVDREAVRRAMAGARALVFPSLGDSFGRVQVEALACGTPVLASDACGEVVTEGCGAIHPAGDAVRLAADIRALMDGSLTTSVRACTGRARTFTWEAFVERLADAYTLAPS